MDVATDRFISLSPISAEIWIALRTQSRDVAVERIKALAQVSAGAAERLLQHQLDRWAKLNLISPTAHATGDWSSSRHLPATARLHDVEASAELPAADTLGEALQVSLLAELAWTEYRYRRSLAQYGLASTLAMLAAENGGRGSATMPLRRVLRNYYAVRRLHRQSLNARDCLPRSFALAAILRRRGIHGTVCIGVVDLPFASHAWVEAENLVVNETMDKRSRFATIGRF